MSFADAIVEQLRQAPYGWQYDWGKWLVLADWLEEHGRQPHATLIRKTHELETARLSRPARSVLIDQIDVLTRRHAPQWLIGAPPFHLTPDRCLWRNGFLSEVSVTWVPGIAPQLDRLLSHPAGMLIRHLRIDAGEHSIGPDGAATLAELEQIGRLPQLELREHQLSIRGAKALTHGSWQELRRLDLYGNDIMSEGAKALAESDRFPKVESIDLSRNQMGDDGALAWARTQSWPSLRNLAIAENSIGQVGMMALLQRVERDRGAFTLSGVDTNLWTRQSLYEVGAFAQSLSRWVGA